MFKFKKEAAWWFGGAAIVAQVAVLYFTANPASPYVWILPVVTAIATHLTRSQVASEATLEKAGTSMVQVVEVAKDPTLQLVVKEIQPVLEPVFEKKLPEPPTTP